MRNGKMSKVLELLDAMNKGKITNQDVIDILTKSDEKLQDKVATLEAKLAQAKMNESFEKEKKDNAFKFIEELKQQLIEECKEHQEFCKVADEKVKELKQQLAESEKTNKRLFKPKQKLQPYWMNDWFDYDSKGRIKGSYTADGFFEPD